MPPAPSARSASQRASGAQAADVGAALRRLVRSIPDFPVPGILFRDITPVLADSAAFAHATALMAEPLADAGRDGLVAIESRGFLFGAALARQLDRPLLLARKPGKLPGPTRELSYALEYGENTLQIHDDAVSAGGRYAVVDDLLATGGTAAAAAELVENAGGIVELCSFFIELEDLAGSKKLSRWSTHSVLRY